MEFLNGTTVSAWIAQAGIWPLIVVLVPNLMFRRYGQAAVKKRMASLLQAIAVFVITTLAAFVMERELTDLVLFIGILIVAVALYILRDKVFPYRLSCPECGVRLDFRTIYFMDDHLCVDCRARKMDSEEADSVPGEYEVVDSEADDAESGDTDDSGDSDRMDGSED